MSLDGNKLQVDLEEGDRWRRTLNVTVPADLVELERSNIAKKLAARIKLPGFRKGHVPKGVLEKRYGAALNQETLDAVIENAYREALARQSVHPISEGEVQNVRFAILGVVHHSDSVELDRDSALPLQLVGVQHLVPHVSLVEGPSNLQHSIGKRRLAVIDMRDNTEVAYVVEVHVGDDSASRVAFSGTLPR